MTNELFIIDLSTCSSNSEIIKNISCAFEVGGHRNRKVGLKLNDIEFNQAQLLSIQSLILSNDSTLEYIECANYQTREVAQSLQIQANEPVFVESNNEPQGDISFDIAPSDTDSNNIEAQDMHANGFKPFDNISNNVEQSDCDTNGNNDFNGNNDGNGNNDFCNNNENPVEEIINDVQQDMQEDVQYDKQVMDTYKKAYDEKDTEQQWEEVDYYAPATDDPVVIDEKQTIYVHQTLRSGQVLDYDGNVVIIGDCHPGSEIKAAGDITVWGVLGSIAHAGIKGNRDAKIRALKMNAVQLRIANCYSRRPDGTNIPYIIKSSTFTPEEARIVDDSIVLFKLN